MGLETAKEEGDFSQVGEEETASDHEASDHDVLALDLASKAATVRELLEAIAHEGADG
jgi:hypothetical protein